MIIDILKEIILDFQNETVDSGIKRHLDYSLVKNKAFICIGVRRCGKSTLMYQIIENLLKKGINRENILYINFFDDRLTELKRDNLSLISDAFFSIYPEKKDVEEIYLFFDEIQEIPGWELFVERVMRTEKCMVFISGSSAKMLSLEIATQMRGRSIAWELFPFSFKEFLDCKNSDYKRLTSKNKIICKKHFDEYFIKGGFPEVRNLSDKIRIMTHQEYYKTILHRDIIERFNAIHPKAVIQAGYRLITSVGSLYSINRITEYLKSSGFKISKDFVANCLQWFEDTYFIFSVKIYSGSLSKQNLNMKKAYCIDHGLVSSIDPGINEKKGFLLENIVFIHLRMITEKIYYYRTKKGNEIDFVLIDNRSKRHLIQVSYSIKSDSTRKRETSSILDAMDELGIRSAKIITLNEKDVVNENGKTIEVLPAWEFLISL